MAGHPGEMCMYCSMQTENHWPNRGNDAYKNARDCREWAWNKLSEKQLFPASGPSYFVAMDILGPLRNPPCDKHFVLLMTDRYKKITKTVATSRKTNLHIAPLLLGNWVLPYRIPDYVLTDNGTQFISKVFESLCGYFGTEHPTTTA